LPAAASGLLEDGSVLYARGIPIGGKEKDTGNYFVYNHAKMTVKYHEDPAYEGARVVGFEVWPLSVQQEKDIDPKCDRTHAQSSTGMPIDELPHMIIRGTTLSNNALPTVLYSYDVAWVPSPIQWASRWDIYLSMGNLYSNKVRPLPPFVAVIPEPALLSLCSPPCFPQVHWFSIFNSLIISVFLTGMVAMILVRALRADIARYNRILSEEEKAEEREESGWK
jgi:transmembrane 9 superfamily protein 2/4